MNINEHRSTLRYFVVLSVLTLAACNHLTPTNVKRGESVQSPASYKAMCLDPKRWDKWVCVNAKPEAE